MKRFRSIRTFYDAVIKGWPSFCLRQDGLGWLA